MGKSRIEVGLGSPALIFQFGQAVATAAFSAFKSATALRAVFIC
jgi:hypothetical protein